MASTRIGPNEYNAAAIEVLEGLEPVRLRPGMYIGGTDAQGLGHLIDEAVANALDEHLAGRATRVAVTVDENDWVTVRDNGGGLPIEPRTASGLSRLEVFFTAVHSGATADGHHPHVHVGRLAGVGIAVVNALSRRLEVVTWRQGRRWEACFERGETVQAPFLVGPTRARGTRIRFQADPEIFEGIRIDRSALKSQLQEVAWLMPGLQLTFQGKRLQNPHGLVEALKRHGPLLPGTVLHLLERHQEIGVEVVIGLTKASDVEPRFESFLNYRRIERGPHQKAMRQAIGQAFENAGPLLRRVVCACHITMLDPRFEGPTRSVLHLPEAVPHLTGMLTRALTAPTDTRIAWLEALRTG